MKQITVEAKQENLQRVWTLIEGVLKAGLGIFMVKKMMDEVSYEFRDGSNVLTIKKYI